MISIYVHIPFCVDKCCYCDFFSAPVSDKGVPHERYCGAVIKQFARDVVRLNLVEKGVGSIYFGGGTPSLMPPGFFEKILWAIGTTCVLQSDVEITCEVNPGTVDAKWFKKVAGSGVNRFSIGVQSFQNSKLKKLGRIYKSQDAQRAIAEAQDSGASKVSVDLMYGLPEQRLVDVEGDLKTAMTFQPQHISAYQLTVAEGTKLASELKRDRAKLGIPREDQILKQLRLVRRVLASGGWEPYEISNFAKPSCVCRHNLHYWRYGEYLGLGSGATSFIRDEVQGSATYGRRWTLTRDFMKYMRGSRELEEEESISARTAMGEYCFLGLRTNEGVSLDDFEERFGTLFKNAFPNVLGKLEGRGLVKEKEGRVVLTGKGVELSNLVFESFVE